MKMNWIDVSQFWDELGELADKRDRQKRGFASTRQWNDESHFFGLLAEQVYSIHSGIQIDKKLRIKGDAGTDFPDTDVKGCQYWRDPWLKHPVGKKIAAATYVLVGLDIEMRRGYIAGYATAEEMKAAPVRNWGHGPQYSIPAKELHSFSAEQEQEKKGEWKSKLAGVDWSAPNPRWRDGVGARQRPFWPGHE